MFDLDICIQLCCRYFVFNIVIKNTDRKFKSLE